MDKKSQGQVSPGKSRKRWIVIWVLSCLLVLAVVFLLGALVRSPWEGAIENSRTPLVATAIVQEREFEQVGELVRGRAQLGIEEQIVPSEQAQGRPVVTAVSVEKGQTVASGDLLAKVSGQPMFLLAIDFPLYRTLTGGDSGDDVSQVQQELQRLGLYTGSVDGVYGLGTSRAVEQLYQRSSQELPGAPSEAQEQLLAAEKELEELQLSDPSNLDQSSDRNAFERAKKNLEDAQRTVITPLRMDHFWAISSPDATVVKIADLGTILTETEAPLATIRTGEVNLTTRVPVSMTETYGLGAKARAVMSTDPAVSWDVVVVHVGEFVTEPDEFDSRPGRNVTFQFDQVEGLTTEIEIIVEPVDSAQSVIGLAVPLTALRENSGETYVNVIKDQTVPTTLSQVPVTVLTASDGFAHVSSETLVVGDTVVVGGK